MKYKKNYPAISGQTVSFTLDEDQVRTANAWAARHSCSRKGMYGTVGDKFSYQFVPTGIGTFVSIHCSCGKSKDLTNDV